MDNISPISRGWRLCIVASCIIPIFFLKHGHDSVNLSTLMNIDITSTISANESDANMQFLQQANFEEHVTQLNEEDKCNIFDGKWVYDPKGSPMHEGAQSLPPSQTLDDVKSGIYKVFTAKEGLAYNFSVEFYWSPFLMQQKVNQDNGARILRLDRVTTSAMK
ncbi:hypothetical protein ACFX2G_047907 [Malus domestica]